MVNLGFFVEEHLHTGRGMALAPISPTIGSSRVRMREPTRA